MKKEIDTWEEVLAEFDSWSLDALRKFAEFEQADGQFTTPKGQFMASRILGLLPLIEGVRAALAVGLGKEEP